MTNTPERPLTIEERMTRLENIFSNMAETIFAQNEAIVTTYRIAQENTRHINEVQTIGVIRNANN
ncbi:hypothetical protein [Scytonema sp. NUACC26]|uniref:hypothetical protein n=1 Tax=Scytonema sp. NUACC26 TaxID=3140176 RepID=UPI0034DC1873